MQLANWAVAMGHPDEGRHIIYLFRRSQAIEGSMIEIPFALSYAWLDEFQFRSLYLIVLFWAFGSVIFWRARRMNSMAPSEKDAYIKFVKSRREPEGYIQPFKPFVYALENCLPVVKLGQDDAWAPDPRAEPTDWFPESSRWAYWNNWLPKLTYRRLSFLRWAIILAGWLLALILAGAIGERFKS